MKARSPRLKPGALLRTKALGGGRPLAGAALALALAVGLAACSSQTEGEEEKVKATVESFLVACATDRPSAQELLTQLAQRSFAEGATTLSSCQHVVPLGLPAHAPTHEDLEALKEAHVTHLSVRGGFATADAEVAGRHVPFALEEIRGRWRIGIPVAGAP